MNQDQKHEQMKAATNTVADIDFLLGREEFRRFMDRFKRQADALADEVLHGDMTADEREKKRQFRLGILEVLRGPAEAKNTSLRMLKQGGVLD